METCVRKTPHELNLAGRKQEEAALRRYEAMEWLESLVGPLGISRQPSEREFISCLRSGLVLCNAINKIQPGSVQKVVENHLSSESQTWDSQPLPAYQYFENVRNFLVAAEKLKLTTFEAPVLERDNLEAGSSAKVVDCILELKFCHERKRRGGENVSFKPQRSPFSGHSVGKIHSNVLKEITSDPHRRLDMTASCNEKTLAERDTQELEDLIVTTLAECLVDKKENIDANLLASFRNGNLDAMNVLRQTMSSCLEGQVQNMLAEVKPAVSVDRSGEECNSIAHSKRTASMENSSVFGNRKCCRACSNKGHCNHHMIFKMQENELSKIKSLLLRTKEEFEDLQSQLRTDMKQLENHVQEMSSAALGYHKVVKENINLHNKVQDLKGLEKMSAIADVSAEEVELQKELESLKKALSNRKLQSSEVNVLKENRSPSDKPKLVTNQTPLRPRRLSIESSSAIRREKTHANKPKETKSLLPGASAEITPPSRRLNIENRFTPTMKKSPHVRRLSIGTSSVVKLEKIKETGPNETNNALEKAQANGERTPPRPRRLSIENYSTAKKGKTAYVEGKKMLKTPSLQIRTRRLSLEGPRFVNKDSAANLERSDLPQAASKPIAFPTHVDSALDVSRQMVPKSTINDVRNNQVARTEKQTRIPSLQLPKTPEPTVFAKSDVVEPLESQTTSTRATANGKASHIRKSLRAIGKLINGSEKRNQLKQKETLVIATDGMLNMKSPVSRNARPLRRQSLSGTQSPVMSSTTSIGVISNGFRSSRAITPPPVRASTKSPKSWL
ncbi:Calponin-homology (CH) domain-containing protein [Heracleum sosnowskyi]|uniref:Calponin-homology (CH) domain-containing protein n=1 Tax=Heracleum sosnowskyi TaxID=360622 RepID=A0AAD8IIZ6_9APIA|nr:Calponin-homology (CH) domain-containing protein [Heracleum sosnowskyi]